MAEQEKRSVPAPAEQTPQGPAPKKQESSVTDGLDDILDEIDEVLETNAEEFVKSYVQKGGQ